MLWYNPQLKKVDIELLVKNISAKAMSLEDGGDCYGGNILKGDIGGGGQVAPGVGGDWLLYCIEVGPLGGCDNWAQCALNDIPILSNDGDKVYK